MTNFQSFIFFEWYCFYRISRFAFDYAALHIKGLRERLCVVIPSALLSIAMIVGFSFEKKHSMELVWCSELQIFKAMTAFLGYFPLFIGLVICLFAFFDYITEHLHDHGDTLKIFPSLISMLYQYPVCFTVCSLFVLSIPYVVFSYPGILMGDPANQISQIIDAVNFESKTGVRIIFENIKLNNHHPVVHTLCVNFFVLLGKLLTGSYSIGLFLYSLFQIFCVIISIVIAVKLLIKYIKICPIISVAFVSYYLFHHYLQQIMMLATKDVVYSVILFVFLSLSCLILVNNDLSYLDLRYKIIIICWNLSAIGVIFFRNEGIFIVVPTITYWIFMSHVKRKYHLSSYKEIRQFPRKVHLICILIIFFVVHILIFPLCGVSRGSVREALSLPFQQAARYLKYARNDVTEEEKRAISKVLNYSRISKDYKGGLSDPVKNTFNEHVTMNDLKAYFGAWWQMFKKHPEIYFEATIDNKYEYFYPSMHLGGEFWCGHSRDWMNRLNKKHNSDFSYPQISHLDRELYFKFHRSIIHLPIIGILGSASFYVWFFILWCFYCVKCKSKQAWIFFVSFYNANGSFHTGAYKWGIFSIYVSLCFVPHACTTIWNAFYICRAA